MSASGTNAVDMNMTGKSSNERLLVACSLLTPLATVVQPAVAAKPKPVMFASPNMSHVATYGWRSEGTQSGTDLEFATIGGFAASHVYPLAWALLFVAGFLHLAFAAMAQTLVVAVIVWQIFRLGTLMTGAAGPSLRILTITG